MAAVFAGYDPSDETIDCAANLSAAIPHRFPIFGLENPSYRNQY